MTASWSVTATATPEAVAAVAAASAGGTAVGAAHPYPPSAPFAVGDGGALGPPHARRPGVHRRMHPHPGLSSMACVRVMPALEAARAVGVVKGKG